MHRIVQAAAMLAAAGLVASEGSAKILATATRAGNYTSTSTTGVAVPLNSASGTALAFATKKSNDLVRVSYNAECGSVGSSISSWTSVRILVDGVEAAPASGTSFAFCTAVGGASTNSWTGALRDSFITVPNAGTHSVQVIAQANNGATSLWLGDSALVIED